MKITKDDLKKVIAEEMANEGFLDMFGSKEKRPSEQNLSDFLNRLRLAVAGRTPIEKIDTRKLADKLETFRKGIYDEKNIQRAATMIDQLRVKKGESERGAAAGVAAGEEAERKAEKARLDKKWQDEQPSLPRDPKYVHRHPGFSVAAEGKITKSELERIIREELEVVLAEGEYRSDPRMDTPPDDEQLRGYPLEPDAGGSDWFIPGTTTGEKASPEMQKMLIARMHRNK